MSPEKGREDVNAHTEMSLQHMKPSQESFRASRWDTVESAGTVVPFGDSRPCLPWISLCNRPRFSASFFRTCKGSGGSSKEWCVRKVVLLSKFSQTHSPLQACGSFANDTVYESSDDVLHGRHRYNSFGSPVYKTYPLIIKRDTEHRFTGYLRSL